MKRILLLLVLAGMCGALTAQGDGGHDVMKRHRMDSTDWKTVDKCLRVVMFCQDRKNPKAEYLLTVVYGFNEEGYGKLVLADAKTGEPLHGIMGGLSYEPGDMAMGKRENDSRIKADNVVMQVKNLKHTVSMQYISQNTANPRSWNYINLYEEKKTTSLNVRWVDFYPTVDAARPALGNYWPNMDKYDANLLRRWMEQGFFHYYNTRFAF